MPFGTATTETIDDQTFTALLQRSTPALRAFLHRLCGSATDADDLLQETLARVWRLRASLQAGGTAHAWLHQAAFRVFCDQRQRDRRRPAATDDLHDEPAPQAACMTELRDELQHRLAGLPEIERELLLGFHRDELSLRELAARHALPVNTVKSHLHRARRRLRDGEAAGEQP